MYFILLIVINCFVNIFIVVILLDLRKCWKLEEIGRRQGMFFMNDCVENIFEVNFGFCFLWFQLVVLESNDIFVGVVISCF